MSYQNQQAYFTTYTDRTRLFYQQWNAEKPRKNFNVVIHHGYGEHSGRYRNVLDAFEGSGCTFYGLDARGHGRSNGLLGHAESIQQMADDLHSFLLFLRENHGVEKPVIIAHSMGGLIALQSLLDEERQHMLRGLVANGSALKVNLTAAMKIMLAIGRMLASLAPKLRLPAGLELKFLSNDQAVIEAYKRDPLVHDQLSTTLGLAIYDGGNFVLENGAKIKLPILLTHGAADGLIPASGTEELYEIISSTDKTLKVYEGLYHEVYNEPADMRKQAMEDLRKWVLDHLS